MLLLFIPIQAAHSEASELWDSQAPVIKMTSDHNGMVCTLYNGMLMFRMLGIPMYIKDNFTNPLGHATSWLYDLYYLFW